MKNIAYFILIVSAILGYSLHFPFVPQVYLFHIVLGVFLFFFSCGVFLKGKVSIGVKKTKNYLFFFIVWFLWILLSFLWAEDRSVAIKFTIIYIIMFSLVWLLISYNQTEKKARKTLKILIFAFLIALTIGTLETFTNLNFTILSYFEIGHSSRGLPGTSNFVTLPTSFFFNPNDYATFLNLSLPFLLFGISYTNSRKTKIILTFLSFLVILNVFATFSRINIIALFFIFSCYFIIPWIKNKDPKILLKYFASFLIVFVLLSFFIATNHEFKKNFFYATNSIKTILNKNYVMGKSDSISIRMTIADEIIHQENSLDLLRGHGTGNSRNFLNKRNIPKNIMDPHSWWLELMADFGLFFLLFYLIFFVSLLRSTYRIFKKTHNRFNLLLASGCFLSLLSFLITSMAPSSVVYFIPHWILIALCIISINLFVKNENSLSR